jgi:DNA adenine methylase
MFVRADFRRLAEILARIAGRFILSINDAPEIREAFAAFDMEPVELVYTINDGAAKAVTELIITPKGLPRTSDRTPRLFDD